MIKKTTEISEPNVYGQIASITKVYVFGILIYTHTENIGS
jgi:hypothetical protein